MNRPEIYSYVYLTGARNCMKVHEYVKFMNNAYLELAEYCDHLEKALDKAIHMIGDLNDCTNKGSDSYRKCPFFDECNKVRFNGCISNNEKWKEELLND